VTENAGALNAVAGAARPVCADSFGAGDCFSRGLVDCTAGVSASVLGESSAAVAVPCAFDVLFAMAIAGDEETDGVGLGVDAAGLNGVLGGGFGFAGEGGGGGGGGGTERGVASSRVVLRDDLSCGVSGGSDVSGGLGRARAPADKTAGLVGGVGTNGASTGINTGSATSNSGEARDSLPLTDA
jgi:hypothetical protein